MGVSLPAAEVARAWVERTCAGQGVPVKVTDPAVIRAVVALVGQTRQSASTPQPGLPARSWMPCGATWVCGRTQDPSPKHRSGSTLSLRPHFVPPLSYP